MKKEDTINEFISAFDIATQHNTDHRQMDLLRQAYRYQFPPSQDPQELYNKYKEMTNSIEQQTPFHNKSLYIFVDNCANLRDWQRDFARRLEQENNDFYILAKPGSGKTAPLICHWVNNILGIKLTQQSINANQQFNNDMVTIIKILTSPHELPQIMWLCPIQALNSNISEDFKTDKFISGIILQFLNKLVKVNDRNEIILREINKTNNPEYNVLNLPDRLITIKTIINLMGNISSQQADAMGLINMIQSPDVDASDLDQYNNIIVREIRNHHHVPQQHTESFRLKLGEFINIYVERCLVGIKQAGSDSSKRNGRIKPVVISIYESASQIIDDFDNLKLIICDEAQRLQGSSDLSDKDRARQIAYSMDKVLNHPNSKKSKLVLLSGTVNPKSVHNLMNFLNEAYNRKFKQNSLIISPDRNPSDIHVKPMTSITDLHSQINHIKHSIEINEQKIVWIIFSKSRIMDIVNSIAVTGSYSIYSSKKLTTTKSQNLFNKQNAIEIGNLDKSIQNISDPLLKKAVSNKIGYIFRPDNPTRETMNDSAIVQYLFKTGKINVLLCTDAIREGMNISVKTMYIPTIYKNNTNQLRTREAMEIGGLVQLLNRVGRSANITGTIYTSPQFTEEISSVLNADFNQYEEQPYEYMYNKEHPIRTVFKNKMIQSRQTMHTINQIGDKAREYWLRFIY